MKPTTRRSFLTTSLAAATAGSLLDPTARAGIFSPSATPAGANDRIGVAVVGVRGKGQQLAQIFSQIQGVELRALCDADRDVLDRELTKHRQGNPRIASYVDIRKLLENQDIDAVVIATPNHWHSLMAIWACQAGKDVYVEKPVSHNIWEGRKIVEAARKYDRIVQTGTQSRSDTALQEVFSYLQAGNLGKIKVARGLCYKRRDTIGKVNGPQPIPENVDYDLWTGPAPLVPLMRQELHYDWHWVWMTGNGDIGNQGVHEMDMCRWVLGQDKLPARVMSIGGRFGYQDDAETPNTQIAIYDYQPAPLIFEVRGLPQKKDGPAMDLYRSVRVGVVIECQDGYFAGGGGGGWIYDNQGKRLKQFAGPGGGEHPANFIQAVRSRKRSDLTADIEQGHLSSALCHMGNVSYRLGQCSQPEEVLTAVENRPEIKESLERFEQHLFYNWVDLKRDNPVLGPWLDFDPDQERFISRSAYDTGRWANDLARGHYRPPFVVPEKV
jgi:predicted dehydrogenase